MKILVIGEARDFEDCSRKLGEHEYTHRLSHDGCGEIIADHAIVFDFLIHSAPEFMRIYREKKSTVFLNAVTISLVALARKAGGLMACTVFGFNGFPTMFNRDPLEISLLQAADEPLLKDIAAGLQTPYLLVDDRVGMVTPRVICMIINEAFYTVQDGTASREDIDLAMKLGTHYPLGPFEWCRKIGLKNVYELLDALYRDTKDERYKISALMKKEYLASGA